MTSGSSPADLPGTPLGRGSTAEVRRLDGGRVVKLFKPHIPAGQIAAEADALARASAAGLPVPRLHERCRHGASAGLILDELAGVSALRSATRRPAGLPRLLHRMADLQARINALPGHGLPAQTEALQSAVERADLPPDLHTALLARLAPTPDAALCHGDYHLGNLMLQAGELSVLDWDKACCGAPAADAARTAVMLRDGKLAGIADTPLAEPVRALAARAYVRAYVRAYSQRTGEAGIATAIAWWLPVATAAKLPFVAPDRRARMLRRLRRAVGSAPGGPA